MNSLLDSFNKPTYITYLNADYDYPITRYQLNLYRDYFEDILVFTHYTKQDNYIDILKASIPRDKVIVIKKPFEEEIVKNIKIANEISRGKTLLFINPAFFIHEYYTLIKILEASEQHYIIIDDKFDIKKLGFLLIKKELLNDYINSYEKIKKKEFNIEALEKLIFQNESTINLSTLKILEEIDYFYFKELDENFKKIEQGEYKNISKPIEFIEYLHFSRLIDLKQSAKWISYSQSVESLISTIARFFYF